MVIFHSYVSLPEGNNSAFLSPNIVESNGSFVWCPSLPPTTFVDFLLASLLVSEFVCVSFPIDIPVGILSNFTNGCKSNYDSIVIWVNMDPSLVIKGVDENIKIFCSLVVLFFLSLSLCRKWLAERIYRFSGQQQIAEWRQNPTCKHRGKTLRTGCAFHQITLTSGFPGRLATPWHSMTFPWIIWGANDLGHQGMTTLQLRQSHIYWESNW